MLAGVSVEYYARMERGDLAGVSPEVLDALARTLRLDEAETDHLHDLARAATGPSRRRPARAAVPAVSPELQRFLDAVTGAAMVVRDRRLDFVTGNPLGRMLFAPILDDPANQGNTARFMFLNPAARSFYSDWEQNADDVVATLWTYVGRNPRDRKLIALIDELVECSASFRHRWSQHNVRHHRIGRKRLHHPVVGDLDLSYQGMEFPANPEWSMFAFTAEPGTPSAERLALLGSLAAGEDAIRATPRA